MSDHRRIYLAPSCCYTDGDGRQWCEDQVWPCADCPDPKRAKVAVYILAAQFYPASDDPEERGDDADLDAIS